jgi:hypothetical protein
MQLLLSRILLVSTVYMQYTDTKYICAVSKLTFGAKSVLWLQNDVVNYKLSRLTFPCKYEPRVIGSVVN